MRFPESEMKETISIRPREGQSGAYGPVYGEAVSAKCYVEPSNARVVNRRGEEVVASLFVVCPAGTAIKPGDEATYDGGRYEVLLAHTLRPGGKASHREVYLRSASESWA